MKLGLFVLVASLLGQIRPETYVPKAVEHPTALERVQKLPTLSAVAEIPTTALTESPKQPITVAAADSPEHWMDTTGIPKEDQQYVQKILGQESGWKLDAVNELGCIGLGQACPHGNKAEMLERCPDWQSNGVCQMQVWNDYALRRYGSWSYAAEWKFCTSVCYNAHTGATVDKHGEPWW